MGVLLKRNFESTTEILSASLNSTDEVSATPIDLVTNGLEAFQTTVNIEWSTSGDTNVIMNLYSSIDGLNYDNQPFSSVVFPVNISATDQYSFVVWDYLYVTLGFSHVSAESNNAIVESNFRAWNRTT